MDLAEYIGLEFSEGGRGPSFDCWGLVRLFYAQEFGIELPSFLGQYTNTRDSDAIEGIVHDQQKGRWIKQTGPTYGNVVLFTIAGRPVHVGVVLDKRKMLHIEKGKNSVIEQYDSPKWKRRTEGYYRWRRSGRETTPA